MQFERASSSATSGSGKSNSGGTTTKVVTRRVEPGELMQNGTGPKHEEWKTSRKIINHKKKQVETRVQRKIIMEDGKVIADSGPQITTKTTEDNHVEETENTERKNLADDADIGIVAIPGSGKVVSEKTETTQTMKEIKEENMQLHDETIQEITGKELHQLALAKPGELAFVAMPDDTKPFRGKLTHYSAKSQKITDKEETKEVSHLNEDGEITTETTKTHHHEEAYDDEVPEDEVVGQPLPEASAETTRKIEYYRDGDEMDSLSGRLRKETEQKMLRALSPERKDAVTSKTLDFSEEEEIRNTETNRWLENHFGSDESDIVETTKTKAGGNVIKIEMSTSRRPSPKEPANGRAIKVDVKSPVDHLDDRDVSKPGRHSATSTPNSNNTFVVHNEWDQVKSDLKHYRSSTEHNNVTTRQRSTSPRRSASPSPPVTTDVKKPIYNSGGLFRRDDSPVRNTSPVRSTPTGSKKTYFMGQTEPIRSDPRPSSPIHHSTPLKRQSSPWKSSPTLHRDYYQNEEERLKRYDAYQHQQHNEHSSVHKVNSHPKTTYESPRSKSPERYYRSDESRNSMKTHSRNVDNLHREKERTHTILKESSRDSRGSKDYYRNGTDTNTVYATVKKSKHKEKKDCSVQASLSDEEEEARLAYIKRYGSSPITKIEHRELQTMPRSSKKSSSSRDKGEKTSTSLTNTPNSSLNRPSKTFYFGDPTDIHYHSTKNSTLDRSKRENTDYSKKVIHTFDKDRNVHPVTYFPGGYYTIERDSRVNNRHASSKYRSYDDLRNGHNGVYKDRNNGVVEDTLVRKNMNRSVSSALNNERSYSDSRGENSYVQRSYNTTADSAISNGRSYHDTRTDESYHRNYRSPKSEINDSFGVSSRSVRDHSRDDTSFKNGHSTSSTSKKDYSRLESSKRHQFLQDLLLPSERDSGLWRSSSSSSLSAKKKLPESRQRQFDYHSPTTSSRPSHSTHERSSSPSSPMPRLIKINGSGHTYHRSSSPSPPESPSPIPPPPPFQSSGGSYYSPSSSLTKTRPTSLNTNIKSSPPTNPPNFTPLLSPTEIKNMANAFNSRKAMREENTKYVRVKPERQDGAVVVEVREWDNR